MPKTTSQVQPDSGIHAGGDCLATGAEDASGEQLHNEGWTKLRGMPRWDLCSFVERLHARYHPRILRLLEQWRDKWLEGDEEDSAPGSDRPGGLVARLVSEQLESTGVFVYAAHPSQADDADGEYSFSGPRWYVTCMEAAMKRYRSRGVAPPPPEELQSLLWLDEMDRRQPWLTELGWTVVPENSDPQVMHADICSTSAPHPRKPGHGRYHHFAWKINPSEVCTTNIVPGAFVEGCPDSEHYDNWTIAQAPALIFDSEMLHRGGVTRPGVGWTSTLTLQVSSGTGWPALSERVSEGLMWYTQPIGWENGDAVDAFVDGSWHPAIVMSRSDGGVYKVSLDVAHKGVVNNLSDSNLRYRQRVAGVSSQDTEVAFDVGDIVEAFFGNDWFPAKICRRNLDNTYRVIWQATTRTFTDGLSVDSLRTSVIKHGESIKRRILEDGDRDLVKRAKRGKLSADQSSEGSTQSRSASSSTDDAVENRVDQRGQELFSIGFVEFNHGLSQKWRRWDVFGFVEAYYDHFSCIITHELDLLRDFWEPCEGSCQRYGSFAATKVTERLSPYGIAIYTPGPSQAETSPYEMTGPRWYVSITQAALEHYSCIAPPLPNAMRDLLCSLPADQGEEMLRLRGLGWTLAPSGSDPQALHADIWGSGAHARAKETGTRWPHLLWKRDPKQRCTTEVVPGGFTEGDVQDEHFQKIKQVQAPAILVNSEALHRGAATSSAGGGGGSAASWISTLSMEFCTPSGWAAWEALATGGTTKDPSSTLDWRMLCVANPDGTSTSEDSAPVLTLFPVQLPPAPWEATEGKKNLRMEKREWEFYI